MFWLMNNGICKLAKIEPDCIAITPKPMYTMAAIHR